MTYFNFIGKLMSKNLSLFVVVLILLASLSACSQQSSTSNIQSNGVVKIGFTTSLSGDFSSDGKALLQGYRLWADIVNQQGGLLGRQVQLDYVNDNSDPNRVTTEYQKLINTDHDDLVVGPYSSLLTVPSAQIAARYGYAFVEGAGVSNSVFALNLRNLFSASLPAKYLMTSYALFILSLPVHERPKTVAFVAADDPFARTQMQDVKRRLLQGGLTQVTDITYPAETTNFTPIAQKVVQTHADAFVLGSVGLPESVAFIKYFKQQHYNPRTFIAASGPDQGSAFINAIGGAKDAEGIFVPNDGWYPGANTYQNSQFTSAYLAKYGGSTSDISSDTVQAYSTGQILEQAINRSHSFDNAKLIHELHSDSFNSLQGPLEFTSDGENKVGVAYLFQWQQGQLIPVYPSDQAQVNPEYPKANWS
jgi:branched-chain amino acid transport system substrate-binding protein